MILLLARFLVAATSWPYCNTAMDTGRIPPLPASAELVQAQVFIRHGARVRCSLAPDCWDGALDAEYDCSAALLQGPLAPTGSALPDGSVLYRKLYTKGRNELNGNCALGQLVADGVAQQVANGRHLREAYGHILPTSPAGANASLFYLRSDDSPRTVASGQALFGALYPQLPGGAAVVVPWHTEDAGGDGVTITCNSEVTCPALKAARAAAEVKAAATPHYANVSVPLAAELSAALNRTIRASGIGGLLDCLMSHACPTVPSRGGAPPAAFTPELQARAVAEAAFAMYAVYNDSAVARLGAGPLIGEMLVAMLTAVAQPASAYRFVLHSGHDTGPMGPLLGALGVAPSEFPRFGDLVAIELYRTGTAASRAPLATGGGHGQHSVRLVHNGEVVTRRVPGCPSDADLCPFESFRAIAAALTPTPRECGRSDEPAWWPRPSSA